MSIDKSFELRPLDLSQPLSNQVYDADVLIPTTAIIDRLVLERASRCRAIFQPAAGFANIDIAAATDHGIRVANAPGMNAQSTAELTLLHMLYLICRVPERLLSFKQQEDVGQPLGRELAGKVLGVVGISGAIGSKVARIAESIGMNVIGCRSTSSRLEFERLLAESDVVTLHVPVTEFTRRFIGKTELALMKPDAMLINTSRACLIDRSALEDGLSRGLLKGGVGLDVFWSEPADPSEALFNHPRVFCTPHVGVACIEVYDRLSDFLVDNIVRLRENRELVGVLNP